MVNDVELSDAQLAEVNSCLSNIVNESGWTRTMAIGLLIADRIFHGHPDTLQERRRAWKNASLRNLAGRADCPLRKTALAETIAVYGAVTSEPDLRKLTGISPSHVAAVLGFPPEIRRALLARASEHKWSVRVLVDRVRNQGGLAANSTTKGGHSQGKRALAFYRGGMKCIREGLHLLLTTNAVEPAEAKDLSATLRELGLLMQQTADALRVVSRTIAPEPMPKILSSASAA